ncbi:glycosyltransferase family 2 protein [Candidatus Pseudoruminococcus sp.]|uniref:glycosyltransferase family 2 protein n=1 Tax=Candidatus Pseudoruminococcus sp. TaxID=3101048 RepID=UPI003999AE2C
MLLFELSFPILVDESKLYFDGNNTNYKNNCLNIKCGTSCSLCSYFNSFSAGKYKKYTLAKNIAFKIKIQGSAEIFIKRENGNIITSKLIKNSNPETVSISFSISEAKDGEIFYPEILAKSDCQIFSGSYETEINLQRDIFLAASFCTYKREKYIISNMERLRDFSLKYSIPLKVFVIDNGSTLPETLSDSTITIIHNPNCGGSGGFARGLLEAVNFGCSHIIFLDDDITLDTNVILKTYSLLKILKPEYYDSFIGGVMLHSEIPYLQHECGALWDGFYLSPIGHEVDLRKKESIIENDKLPKADYQAWWYCCFPTAFGEKFGYPMPYFIKSDDVEYGIRCRKPIITMNGIAVWHDGFEGKYAGHFEYYIKRNELINTALHNKNTGVITNIRKLFASITRFTLLQRYFLAELIVKAYDDFMEGPEKLLSIDIAEYNTYLSSLAKPSNDNSIIGNAKVISKPKIVNFAIYYPSFGGNIFPSKNICIKLPLTDTEVRKTFRARYIAHTKSDGSFAFVTKLKKRKLFWVVGQTIRIFFKFLTKYKKVRKAYISNQKKLSSKQYWQNYFSK